MKSMVSWVMTWPGTMIGKPGGYGITKLAETSSGRLQALVDLGLDQRDVLAALRVIGRVEAAAHVAFVVLLPASPRKRRGSG
jgi:hypothetical protein